MEKFVVVCGNGYKLKKLTGKRVDLKKLTALIIMTCIESNLVISSISNFRYIKLFMMVPLGLYIGPFRFDIRKSSCKDSLHFI